MTNIIERFIDELDGQELRPAITDSRVFVQAAGWQTSQYFSKYYEDKLPYTLLLLVKGSGGMLYLPLSKEKALAKEVFRKYWKDDNTLTKIKKEFNSLGTELDRLYQSFNYKYLSENTFPTCLATFNKFESTIWNLNALVFFSIYFDKQIATELVRELSINISEDRLNKIWDKAITPNGISFEKRRTLYIWSLIKDGTSWDKISELCQYFLTSYAKIFPLSEVKEHLIKEYSHIDIKRAEKLIGKELTLIKAREEKYNKWLSKITKEEVEFVTFMQFIIALRDERKDFLMKATTIFYRIGEKLFSEAGVEKSGIYFWSIPEIKKGIKYLKDNLRLIKKREKGYIILISGDNTRIEEYNDFEKNKKDIIKYFNEQYKKLHTDNTKKSVIKGHTGSKGLVRGIVKVLNNFEEEKGKFKKGEILVTGMTRPEYVPLMKIASAIITDEGGITCHAAIVSRELGIPCIIGTKIATQVLKDGDLVEVDADKGIVRRL
ncbi:MAG: PEP-utilizing enzyme [Candidatus Paceibacterota bacterium]|jgi:phosphohistidine swiveling domain-containing protein